MNCCDEYGDCRQGRDCPIRKERLEQTKPPVDPRFGDDKLEMYIGLFAISMLILFVLSLFF